MGVTRKTSKVRRAKGAPAWERLRKLREKLGISQEELARRIEAISGVKLGQGALSKLERGKTVSSPSGLTTYALEVYSRHATPDAPILVGEWYA
jgi:transcriptional regulator with XRE-family HTH domain